MAGFTIDDVRDTMPNDVRRMLERIAGPAAAQLRRMDEVARSSEEWVDQLRVIEHGAHAVYGTTSLVGARSMAGSARMVEQLAQRGAAELRRAGAHALRARQVVEACQAAAAAMGRMLELELEKRGEEAQALALGWQQPAEELLAAIPAEPTEEVPPPQGAPGGAEQERGDAGGAGAAREEERFSFAEGSEYRAELDEVFALELAEARRALVEHFGVLAAEPGDLACWAAMERLLHSLKGAAATVGRIELSEACAALREHLEDLIEEPEPPSGETVREALGRVNALLVDAGSAPITAPSACEASPPGAKADFAAVRAAFLAEAGRLREALIAASRRGDAAGALPLLHRLKGSALVAGEARIAEEAARLQAACAGEQPAASWAAEVGALAALVEEVAGEEPLPPAASAPVREDVPRGHDPELAQAFAQECGELLEQLVQASLGLEESDDPKQSLKEILRATHTLKGVVNTMGLAPTGRIAHRVEDFLEALLEARVLPPMRTLASLLLEFQAGVRRNLETAAAGWVETDLPLLEGRFAALLRGEIGACQRVEDHGAPTSAGSRSEASVAERSFVRVATDRLDGLMNLVGELVVSRSRLLDRVGVLHAAQQELERSYRRLTETVENFREEHEFALMARVAPRLAVAGGAPVPAQWGSFSELELDRYEDVQMLSRSLAEISSDFSEGYGQLARGMGHLLEDADHFGGIVGGIQDEVTRSRMVPVGLVFSRLRLPIREAAERAGKDVRVVQEGEDVSLDKTIADALLQPMLHLVRNAVWHGVESSEQRTRLGKPPAGAVRLRARQESGQIVVEVGDDGAGLDLARLRARGVELGLIGADVPLDDPSIRDLVFAPGLSTAAEAGHVSGRGIGGDVVRRTVERLNGSIRVQTDAGRGTTFSLTLPLTLAITKAMLVREAGRVYAVPMYFAERLVESGEAELLESPGGWRIKLGTDWVGVTSLAELLGADPDHDGGAVLSLRVGDQRLALRVGEVLGQEEIVVKDLGPILSGHRFFGGITLRGSGELALILDVPRILESRSARVTPTPVPAPRAGEELVGQPRVQPAVEWVPRRRVLFVDDSISVRKVAERTFRDLGVEVVMASDGVDALAQLGQGSFDIVFTDLEMPRMHGYELIRELRFLPRFRELPIVVVTSRSAEKHKQHAAELGANQYLTKPFTTETIKDALDRWAGPRRGR